MPLPLWVWNTGIEGLSAHVPPRECRAGPDKLFGPLLRAKCWGGRVRGGGGRIWEGRVLPPLGSGPLLAGSPSQTPPEGTSAVGTAQWASRRKGCRSCEWLWNVWLLSNLGPPKQKRMVGLREHGEESSKRRMGVAAETASARGACCLQSPGSCNSLKLKQNLLGWCAHACARAHACVLLSHSSQIKHRL